MVTLANRGIDLLEPIADALLEHILESAVLTVDETPIKVGTGVDGKLKQGWLWPIHREDGEIFFLFDPGRGTTVISNVIPPDFQGVLLTDGYTVYTRLARLRPNFIHAVCRSHTRRKFVDAINTDQAAQECLLHIRGMYRQEALIREEGLEGEEKLAARRARCLPAAEAFRAVCDSVVQRTELEPSHPLMKAVGYACKRRRELMVCFGNPEVPFDTNHVERAIRPVAMGKRNWMFAGNEEGARRIGIIQSLLASCKLQGIDPRTWLIDVLQRVGCHPAGQVHELTPRLWKQHFAERPFRSDVDTS
jgi:transposase